MKSAKEILIEAAALGRKVGVAQGTFYDKKDGSMCINGLIGAVIKGAPIEDCAEYGQMVRTTEYKQVVDVIAPVIGVPADWCDVANWNNNLTDTKEVLTVLEKAAASIQ